MKPRLLVLTTVHPSDDPRIRRKLIGTLQDDWAVTYAGKGQGPVDAAGIEWVELRGGRLVRWLRAARLILTHPFDVAVLHDPELLPLGIVASVRKRAVVFDVHENIPAQLRTKEWLPRWIRRPLAALFGWLMRIGETRLAITLAEGGYAELFRKAHPVFPNYLVGRVPSPREPDVATGLVYLGDVTEPRGIAVVVEAAGRAGVPVLSIMGRCTDDFRTRLLELAAPHALELRFHGFVSPERALEIVSGATVALSPLLDTPNYRHSLPTKVLEYLAVGVPTIASDLPGTRGVVGDRPGLVLVPPGDTAAWTEAIANGSKDSDLRQAAQDGADSVRADFSWPTEAVRTFYSELLT